MTDRVRELDDQMDQRVLVLTKCVNRLNRDLLKEIICFERVFSMMVDPTHHEEALALDAAIKHKVGEQTANMTRTNGIGKVDLMNDASPAPRFESAESVVQPAKPASPPVEKAEPVVKASPTSKTPAKKEE